MAPVTARLRQERVLRRVVPRNAKSRCAWRGMDRLVVSMTTRPIACVLCRGNANRHIGAKLRAGRWMPLRSCLSCGPCLPAWRLPLCYGHLGGDAYAHLHLNCMTRIDVRAKRDLLSQEGKQLRGVEHGAAR